MKLFNIIFSVLLVCLSLQMSAQFTVTNLENQLISMHDYESEGLMIHLPSVSTGLISSGYTYGDLYDANTKTLSIQAAADLKTDLNVLANVRGSYGGLEWRKGNWGLTLNHEWIADVAANLPEETVQLVVQGNVNVDTRNTRIQPKATYQQIHRFSIGGYYSGDKGLIGAKLHYLNGVESLYTDNFSVEINAQEDFFALEFHKNINIMSSGVLNYNSLDDIEYIGGDQVFSASPFTSNRGFGLSVYGKVDLGDQLKVYGIIDDIGTVKWSRQAVSYTDKSTSSFNGIDIREAYLNDQEYSLQDTLYSLLSLEKDVSPFTSSIGLSILTGIQYSLSDELTVEASYRARAINGKLFSIADVIGRYQLTEGIRLSLSNRFAASKFINIGLGAELCIAERFGLNINTTNPWSFGKYYDMPYGDFNFGMYYWIEN